MSDYPHPGPSEGFYAVRDVAFLGAWDREVARAGYVTGVYVAR
jgi:hypothetical protein